jgi:hypothetical protein
MTLIEFKNKYLGKQVEYHSFGTGALNQCIDLTNQYTVEVLGLTPIIGTNAKDVKDKFNPEEFEWIVNTTDAIIKKGDIPVWNGRVGGGAGHIAIALEDGNQTNFVSLDQNWSQKERVTIENHNYTNVSGWLRPKKQAGEVNTDVQKNVQFDRITSFLNSISILPTDRSEDYLDNDKLVEGVKNLDAENKRKAEEITKLTEQLNQVHIEAGELKSEISDRQNAINTLNLKISDLNQAMEADAVEDHDMGVKILNLEKQLAEKDREIADLKEEKAAPIEPVIDHYEPILDEFWKNLIKGKKTKSLVDKFWGWIR